VKRLEFVLPNNNSFTLYITTFALFVIVAVAEIGGGYLVWQWLRERKKNWLWIDWRFHTVSIWSNPHISALKFWQGVCCLWWNICGHGNFMGSDNRQKRPDRYEIIGGIIVLVGASIIFYSPR
jgi:small multidrug resistance family-3 protein